MDNKSPDSKVILQLSPKSIFIFLLKIVSILFILHLVTRFLVYKHLNKLDFIQRLDFYFNLDNEQNVPTFFSFTILLFSSALLYSISILGNTTKQDKKYWLLLSIIFLFLSLDEAIELHERLITPLRRIFIKDLSGFLHWGWIVPYSILFLAIGIYFLKFLFRLDKKVRNSFFLAAFIFVFGAVIIESIEGHFYEIFEPEHIIFYITITLQEIFEMIGVIIFIKTLLQYLLLNKEIILSNSDLPNK